MMLVEETSVPAAALPTEAFKAHLRLGSGFADDSLQDGVLEGFLRAAITAIEARTGKALIARGFSWSVARWRDGQAQRLPVAPAQAIATVELEDAQGERVTVSPSSYRLVPDLHAPELRPIGASLPTVPTGGRVVIGFTAGFGPGWADVPADMQQAVLMLAAHYYEYRGDTGLHEGCMPFGVTSLLERWRPLRVGPGGQS